jgi:hypothetical protein
VNAVRGEMYRSAHRARSCNLALKAIEHHYLEHVPEGEHLFVLSFCDHVYGYETAPTERVLQMVF